MNRKHRIAVVVLAIVGVSAAAAAAAPHAVDQRPQHNPPRAAKPTRTVEHDAVFGRSVTVRQVDRRRGLIFVLDGSVTLVFGTERVIYRPGDSCNVPAGTMHEEHTEADGARYVAGRRTPLAAAAVQ